MRAMHRLFSSFIALGLLGLVGCAAPEAEGSGSSASASSMEAPAANPFAMCGAVEECKLHVGAALLFAQDGLMIRPAEGAPVAFRKWHADQLTTDNIVSFRNPEVSQEGDGYRVGLVISVRPRVQPAEDTDVELSVIIEFTVREGKVVEKTLEPVFAG